YILDLSPKNSFISWLVGQGYTVFVISWVNPDESYREITFDDYLKDGPLWAMDVIQSITSQNKINAIGYCLGGTLLATLLGYLASQSEKSVDIAAATFFTTMIDFGEPGDLGVFVDEESVSQLETKMATNGYLDGKSMASTFNMMRSNDLIWHFVINNYLLGKPPAQFDLLYWNSDSTRLPAAMHSYYLRKMYLENKLAQPEGISVLNTPIDLSKVRLPTTFVSTELDHIAPWRSTYSGAKLFSGKVQFILGQSGHIAGIINPPSKNKYGYWISTKELPVSADEWLESATSNAGSWWPKWEKWIKRYSGKRVPAREPGSDLYTPLADAPGTYVNL
ncbi:MAG: alpha/beta fold hydrolase, partial [Gammaproteobacteria bacterium]|nr:alpha/beta fold hydrolase [Gammaproteobacteria bacterium]